MLPGVRYHCCLAWGLHFLPCETGLPQLLSRSEILGMKSPSAVALFLGVTALISLCGVSPLHFQEGTFQHRAFLYPRACTGSSIQKSLNISSLCEGGDVPLSSSSLKGPTTLSGARSDRPSEASLGRVSSSCSELLFNSDAVHSLTEGGGWSLPRHQVLR